VIRSVRIGVAIAVILSGCGEDGATAQAAVRAGDLTVTDVWMRPTPDAPETAAIYMTIDNAGADPDRLVAANAAPCPTTGFHETVEQDGVARMRPIAGGIAVAPGSTVILGPSGIHVMCFDVTGELAAGDSVPVELTFQFAGPMTVEAAIRSDP